MARKRVIPSAVYIWDIDYIAKGEPNFLGMRIASFHKQMGDYVVLLEPKDKPPKQFKQMYILRRDDKLDKPSIMLLYDSRVKVYGIEHFSNWMPPAVILACRPDYTLYPRGRDKFERADAVQLSDDNGHLLTIKQNDRNIETNKDTVVTDDNFWALSNEDVATALKSIKNRKNIYFLQPIPLARILHDQSIRQAFLDLNLAQTVLLQWDNSIPFKRDGVEEVLAFFDDFKATHFRNKIGDISFYPKPRFTSDRDNILLGFWFLMELKKRQMLIKLKPLHSRLDSPYAHAYELLRTWSEQPHMSWMEIIALRGAGQFGVTIEQYYCHSEWWYDEMFRAGIDLMLVLNDELKPLNEHWMLWQYKDHYYPAMNINWSEFRSKTLWY